MSKIENLEQFDSYRTFHNYVVITIPGRDGFLWIEPGGEVHNADMDINVTLADVEVFFDSATGKMSAGWIKKRTAL